MRFDWDLKKSRANLLKHGVSFEDAQAAFYDQHGLLLDDPDHSEEEDRFILLGMGLLEKLLIVCHCYRCDDEVIRIISARKANKQEHRLYGERQ